MSPSAFTSPLHLIVEQLRFLWAELQIPILFRYNSDGVFRALDSLPRNIQLTYERILKDLDAYNLSLEHDTTRKILLWLVAAARPLNLDEIHAALSVRLNGPRTSTNPAQGDSEGLVSLCGPLVRLVPQEGSEQQQVSLAHFSVKEYLISGKILTSTSPEIYKYHVDLEDAHLYLAKVSLAYMSSKEVGEAFENGTKLDEIRKKHKLLDYAVFYGGTHLRPLQKADDTVIELLNNIFLPKIKDRQDSVNCNKGFEERLRELLLSGTDHTDGTANRNDARVEFLKEIAFLGSFYNRPTKGTIHSKLFLELFTILNDWRQWRSKEHPPDMSPLYYASLFGWSPGVTRILEQDPDQRQEYVLNHAIRAAAMGGFVDVIELLHEAGADADADLGYKLGSPLQSAAYVGNEEAVRKLLELGANPDSGKPFHRTGGTVGSALQGAALCDNKSIVQLLIDKGADINSNKGWLGTPLQAVLEAGKLGMSMFLIRNPKFNPDVTGGYYGSASRFCCFEGSTATHDVLEAILNRGGSPSERVGPYGSLLEIACHFGHIQKVALLLNRGAVPGILSAGTFGNAIHAAAMSGNTELVDLVIRHGANPNCPGRWIGYDKNAEELTPGNEILTLQQGKGFLAFDHSRITEAFFAPMLHSALRVCEVDHNKIFIVFENEITHREGHLGNPLQGAAFRGHSDAIKKLIQHGANVNEVGGFFGTALQAAASQGHMEAVETLLKCGADPNIVSNGHYGTALAAAIALKFDKIASTLISKMADPRVMDEHDWNPKTWSVLQDWILPNISLGDDQPCRLPSRWCARYRSAQLLVDDDTATVEFPDEVLEYMGKRVHFRV